MKVLTIRPRRRRRPTKPEGRPEKCPHCRSIYLHRHGYSTKQPPSAAPAKPADHEVKQVVTVRYKCARCSRTFRHYPSGVTRADQSQRRPRSGAAVAWAKALRACTRSAGFARAAEGGWLFEKFGAGIGKSTALRDVRTVSEQQRKVRVLGLDGTLVKIRGQEHGIIIALDLGTGQPVGIARIPEHDVKALLNWLEPLVKACGVEVIVRRSRGGFAAFPRTTWLLRQRPLAAQAHCRFHLKRRLGRLIKTFEAELGEQVKPILDEVRRIIDELPQDGGKRRSAARLG